MRKYTLFFIFIFYGVFTLASPSSFVLQGKIVKPDGDPLEDSSVQFRAVVLSAVDECVLYEETFSKDMSNSKGVFNLSIGSGVNTGATGLSLFDALDNSSTTHPGLTCVTGTTFTPSLGNGRRVRLTFDDGTGPITLSEDHMIESVPYAQYAGTLEGKRPDDFINVNLGVTQVNLENIFDNAGNYSELLSLISGSSGLYAKVNSNGAGQIPSFTNASPPLSPVAGNIWLNSTTGQVIYHNGSSSQVVGGGSGTVTSITAGSGLSGGTITNSGTVFIAPGGVQDSHLSSGINASKITFGQIPMAQVPNLDANKITSGIISSARLNVGIAANEIVQLDGTGRLPAVDGSQLTNLPSSLLTSVHGRTGLVVSQNGDYTATQITNTAAGGVVAITTQAAINELDLEKLNLTGGTLSGNLVMGANFITGLSNPSGAQDAATKNYVDTVVTGAAGTPGGVTTQVQFNNTGSFAGDSNFVWDNVNGRLGVGTATPGQALDVAGNIRGTQLCIGVDCRSAWPSGGGGAVTSVFGRTGIVSSTAGDYTASEVTNVAAGSIVAITTQAAINELDLEKLNLTGGTLSGNLVMGANFITGLSNPSGAQDAATKSYVDTAIAGVPSGADHLGNHTATQNIILGSHYLSGDGGNEGVTIDSNGNVGIGGVAAPANKLEVNGRILASSIKLVWIVTDNTSNGNILSTGDNLTLDSSGGAYSLTLPDSPEHADLIKFVHAAGSLVLNSVTLNPGVGDTIVADTNLVLDVNNISIDLFFYDPDGDGNGDWRLY